MSRYLVRWAAVILAVLASGTKTVEALGGVIVLPATGDGTLFESAVNAESSGIGPTLFVGRISQSGGLLRRGLVQFDVAENLPEGATIQEVRLGMRLSRKAPDLEETTLTLHRLLQAWGEGTSNAGGLGGLGVEATPGDVTWTASEYPGTAWTQAGGSFVSDPSASLTINDLGDILWQSSPGLVDDVQRWIDQPSLDHGWLIRGDETQLGTAVRLDSREHAMASARPFLEVTYAAPEPSAAVTLVLCCLVAGVGLRTNARRVAPLLAALVLPLEARAQPDQLPSIPLGAMRVRLEKVAEGLNGMSGGAMQYAPTDMVFPGDTSGRMFVVTLGGVIRVGTPGGELAPEPFLNTFGPQSDILPDSFGMTAMTFHPGFADTASPGFGKFYTLETEKRTAGVADLPLSLTGAQRHQTVLYEYTMDEPAANVFVGSKRQVFRIGVPGFIHDTNDLVFGPDGYLYVASGDGCNEPDATGVTCSDNARFLGNTFGKILRINPLAPDATPESDDLLSENAAYRVPRDNPFTGASEARPENFALGLRNPYRLTFDRETGKLYTGDVGQRNIESIDEIVAAGDYGWNAMEGTFLYDKSSQNQLVPDEDLNGDGVGDYAAENGYREPLFQYDHQDGKSVVGGYVYRGELLPELNGKYLFGDFRGPANRFVGRLFLGDLASGGLEEVQVSASGEPLPDLIYAFSEDEQGEIYVLGGENDGSTGAIYRIVREFPLGDTNEDGRVDLEDLNNVRNHFGGLGLGDTNFDGRVDLEDLNNVRNNFGASNAPNPVPEPSSFLLLAPLAGASWLVGKRRTRGGTTPRS